MGGAVNLPWIEVPATRENIAVRFKELYPECGENFGMGYQIFRESLLQGNVHKIERKKGETIISIFPRCQ